MPNSIYPEKHARYLSSYRPNDLFWGIGIENETYLQFSEPIEFMGGEIQRQHNPERYSVSYFNSYNPEYKQHLKLIFPDLWTSYKIPMYINSHTFLKTDLSGNHKTSFNKMLTPNHKTSFNKMLTPNPEFNGETVHEYLCRTDPIIFKRKYKNNYIYDGDTIEFMTQRYYKTTVEAAVEELILEKSIYLPALNTALTKAKFITPQTGPIIYPPINAGFATYHTNPNNISTFNNGTYHLNFTLPTQLGSDIRPVNQTDFILRHRNAIRYIQSLEPLIIAIYGSPDPFAKVAKSYSKISQRATVSRYIGIGTYDTTRMPTGKILTIPISRLKFKDLPFWWYTQYHKTSSYSSLDEVGMDVNFNKHGTHGIEIRFLDSFAEGRLIELMRFLVYLFDFSIQTDITPNDPTILLVWNQIVIKAIEHGPEAELSKQEIKFYTDYFKLPDQPITATITSLFYILQNHLSNFKGICASTMLDSSQQQPRTIFCSR